MQTGHNFFAFVIKKMYRCQSFFEVELFQKLHRNEKHFLGLTVRGQKLLVSLSSVLTLPLDTPPEFSRLKEKYLFWLNS